MVKSSDGKEYDVFFRDEQKVSGGEQSVDGEEHHLSITRRDGKINFRFNIYTRSGEVCGFSFTNWSKSSRWIAVATDQGLTRWGYMKPLPLRDNVTKYWVVDLEKVLKHVPPYSAVVSDDGHAYFDRMFALLSEIVHRFISIDATKVTKTMEPFLLAKADEDFLLNQFRTSRDQFKGFAHN